MNRHPELYAFALAALAIVCATALLVTNHAVPDSLWIVAVGATTGGAGLAPGPRSSATPAGSPAAAGSGP